MISKDDNQFLEGNEENSTKKFSPKQISKTINDFTEEEKFSFGMKSSENDDQDPSKTKSIQFSYNIEKIVSKSKFSLIYQATIKETGETVAIKKTLMHRNYKNRELDFLKNFDHPNIIVLRRYFYTREEKSPDIYFNIVMDYVPETMQKMIEYYTKKENSFPKILLKIFSYQIFKAISYLHSLDICHRNIKPSNLLINPISYRLMLCDFGSAKKLMPGQKNFLKICSRYRAPEIFEGTGEYTTKIDIWSAGCILVEMIIGLPIFQGDTDQEQLAKIYNVIGEPSNKSSISKGKGWTNVFKNFNNVENSLVDLISKILKYEPEERLNSLEILGHSYFDEIREKNLEKKLVGINIWNLYDFSQNETISDSFNKKLIPAWLKPQQD